jgi:nucleotide-binding universal stress UspA family protein
MKTILVPLDGSALAERVLPYVRELAPLLDAKVCLLQSFLDVEHDTSLAAGLLGAYGFVEAPEALQERTQRAREMVRQHAEGYLATQALRLREYGLDVETEVMVGSPAKVIVDVARERHATLIAMATHGYGGLKRLTLGSVTDQVAHMATAPVLVVPGAAEARQADPTFERILVPLDGSALANQVLPLAIALAAKANAELVLLEAITPTIETQIRARPFGRPLPRYSAVLEMLHRQAAEGLGALANQLHGRGVRASTAVKDGPAGEVIVEEAARRRVDLIVMATHGYSGLKRWALGSVAYTVLHAATTPLLLVRARVIESQIGAGEVPDSESMPRARAELVEDK